MIKTNTGLVAYAKYQVDHKNFYWYGCVGFRPSLQLLAQKTRQYPDMYPPKKWTEESFTSQILPDRLVFDCVGLIKAYVSSETDDPSQPVPFNSKYDVSANGLFNLCQATGPISTIPEIPGLIVWKNKHVGVYAGDGYVYEAQGHAQGCRKTRLDSRPFTQWGKLPSSWISYEDKPTPKEDKCMVELDVLKKGSKGSSVKSLQILLNGYGYTDQNGNKLVVDGSFGGKTDYAVKALQKNTYPACGEVDGVCGKKTWTKLIEG